ncbi:MAG: GNAT family N-acetyltransferase [Acidobacteriota bacterium]
MQFELRKANRDDQERIERLIAESVRGLGSDDYSPQQIELSIKSVFGVDLELIDDQTYFVAEAPDETLVGCGGWSKRRTLYGASSYEESRDSKELDPQIDAAKIRAFFIDPDFARKGIGTLILKACEDEAISHGFKSAEMMSTLPGVKLYSVHGYTGDERVAVPVGEGVSIDCIRMTKELR